MAAVGLKPGIQVLAFKIQEADAVHSDVSSRLQSAISDAHKGSGEYGYYVTHTGDGETGDVIYSSNGDLKKAPYEMGTQAGKAFTNVDMESSSDVTPVTSYMEDCDDDDNYASMEEAFKKAGLYTTLPLYERFISKDERSKASDDDFAGKGKSFPILKPEDVSAAVHAMGRAGDKNVGTSTLKSRIVAIATKKGWTKYLPKAWQSSAQESAVVTKPSAAAAANVLGVEALRKLFGTGDTSTICEALKSNTQEAARAIVAVLNGETLHNSTALSLCESAATLEQIVLKEARADYEIKLIAPGKGSSAFYPKEVLQRDGPKVFKAGTHVYLNHPTSAEEAARPEGDVKNLAGVLASDAVYNESHAKGPGLYARMKVFADHGTLVEEKAPHVGMSIRANGIAESGKQKDGLPILKELTSAESVDVVTRAGAGGMILTESARTNSQEGEMTLQEAQKLIDEGIAKATTPLIERGIKLDAREEAARILDGTVFREARFAPARAKVIEAALRNVPKKDGALDVDEFRKIVAQEAKDMGEFLGTMLEPGKVTGLGASFGQPAIDPAKVKEAKEREKQELIDLDEAERGVFGELTGLQFVGKKVA